MFKGIKQQGIIVPEEIQRFGELLSMNVRSVKDLLNIVDSFDYYLKQETQKHVFADGEYTVSSVDVAEFNKVSFSGNTFYEGVAINFAQKLKEEQASVIHGIGFYGDATSSNFNYQMLISVNTIENQSNSVVLIPVYTHFDNFIEVKHGYQQIYDIYGNQLVYLQASADGRKGEFKKLKDFNLDKSTDKPQPVYFVK
ncbi:hypothetical protein WOSG25_050310 [Weissella oryzae SG25]|uniref:Uncharacterized protein n=2 Tax=Weissella TaxID=46255 RepID=A0A069CTH2_WEIOS|nr:hypothetical protein WOSG25_050310 [Weissella oryzae SG25]